MSYYRAGLAALIILIIFYACKKNDDLLSHSGEGYWSLDTDQYTITKTERTNNSDYFILSGKESASSSNILQLYFKSQPTANSKYKVVQFEENVPLSSNQIGIKVHIPTTGTYSSTGIADNRTWLPAPDADVSINAGKIKVDIPKMTTIIMTSRYLDTVMFQGILIEK